MTTFLMMVGAVVVGMLLVGICLRLFPSKAMRCAFCGEESKCVNDIVEHVKRCKAHPLKRELDGAVEHVGRVCEQRNRYRDALEDLLSIIPHDHCTSCPEYRRRIKKALGMEGKS
jgi:thioredoxin-like negative regulator of GroEL